MIDRDRQLANQRQAGVLQQIVNVVDGTRTGVFNGHDGVIRLAGLDLVKDIGKFCAAALNKFFEMASGILTCGQVAATAGELACATFSIAAEVLSVYSIFQLG